MDCISREEEESKEKNKVIRETKGRLFEDEEFEAVQSSVFYHQTPPFKFTWKRPKELCTNPKFVQDEINGNQSFQGQQFDVFAGKLGDGWLVSCMGCVALNRALFYRVVPADQSFQGDQYDGSFRFRICWFGRWKEVTVDDRLPTVDGQLVFVHSQRTDQFWAPLLEKAYAKLHGSYEALKYGSTVDGLGDFTGGLVENINLRQDTRCYQDQLNRLLTMTSIVTCIFEMTEPNLCAQKLANGIVVGINYQLMSIDKVVLSNGQEVQLIRLRNPIGMAGYVGSWARNSSQWELVDLIDKKRIGYYANSIDSQFWMPYGEFLKTFSKIEAVHLDRETSGDETNLKDKRAWQMKSLNGSWCKGVSSGGCRNNADSFHVNPQYELILEDTDQVIISINQHSVAQPKVVGFSCYSTAKNLEHYNKTFFKRNKVVVSSPYANNRQVSRRCGLKKATYVLVPTTYEPGEEGSFTLRVYSSIPVKLKLLDLVPKITKLSILKAPVPTDDGWLKNYDAIFLQASNEHKTIDAFELHDLLEACLPNDYVKSCAHIDVCRLVLSAFHVKEDEGRMGVKSFNNLIFSLKHWQSTFKSHTKTTVGILKVEKLRDALFDIGFQLNAEILRSLVLRHMKKDNTLRFGDFVACILQLNVTFGCFEKKDRLQNGWIKLTLQQWLQMSLKC